MGKRSDFRRRPQDAYDTPLEAVVPLLRHLEPGTRFYEPRGAGYEAKLKERLERYRALRQEIQERRGEKG